MSLEILSRVRCFGGEQRRYQHHSRSLGCDMRVSVFLPPASCTMPRAMVTVPVVVLPLTPAIPAVVAGEEMIRVPAPSFTVPAVPTMVLEMFRALPAFT